MAPAFSLLFSLSLGVASLLTSPLAPALTSAAAPAGALLSIVWLLPESDAFGAWPIVSGAFFVPAFCSPGFMAGATFSAGAFCCAAGARAGASSFFMPCAETAPAPSSNTAAVVDNSRRVFMDVSFGQSANV